MSPVLFLSTQQYRYFKIVFGAGTRQCAVAGISSGKPCDKQSYYVLVYGGHRHGHRR